MNDKASLTSKQRTVPCPECHHPDGAPQITNLVGRCKRCHGVGRIDALPGSALTNIPMEARSLLRQAPCPECGKPGYGSDTGCCTWCDQRDKVCQGILDMPSDETTGKPIGAQRYVLKVGHSQDAGLGAEGWVVRMSDHFSDCEPGQKWVKSEDYEALRQRFERACQRVTELESSSVEPTRHLTESERASFDRALRNSTRVVHEGEMAPEKASDECQHDLLLPNTTISVDPADPFRAWCTVCKHDFRTRAPLKDAAPFGVCVRCKQPITSFHNINGCPSLGRDEADDATEESMRDSER